LAFYFAVSLGVDTSQAWRGAELAHVSLVTHCVTQRCTIERRGDAPTLYGRRGTV